ncbi:hypothetical protein [Micromonospora rifamycinica]|uniref:Uncharacterized protein n=1 Tax=Micromonospora rifamycinica TaxID=291594 RepID=A0A109IIE4_9ACTN|nr:hypothetical protein [Micromonospora rifamycinica]KWV31124.1 hypothetical protein AWV63_19310 [Micromonospora rifamycinica]SCG51403.1 hypothetical protein GA0070623_1924 [Micromonospora rifamycinica]
MAQPAVPLEVRPCTVARPLRVTFVDATYSAAKLEGWAAKVRNDQAFWQRQGVTVHGVGTDFGRCVTVGLADPQRDGATVLAHYPEATLCVEQGYASDPLTAS